MHHSAKSCQTPIRTLWTFGIRVLLLVAISLHVGLSDADAQRPTVPPAGKGLGSNLWYGGGLALGFQSGFSQSSFLFGLSPMVGYKITPAISIGPRVGVAYQYLRARGVDGRVYKFHPIDLSGAGFARAKIFRPIFAHVEFEVASRRRAFYDGAGVPFIGNLVQETFYVGGGYSSGGKWATEFYGLLNTNPNRDIFDPPYVLRGGLTYNF